MRLQIESNQLTKDALSKAKSVLLHASWHEQNQELVHSMEIIAGEIEALQSRIKPSASS